MAVNGNENGSNDLDCEDKGDMEELAAQSGEGANSDDDAEMPQLDTTKKCHYRKQN